MCKKAVLIMTSAMLLTVVTLSFSQDRIQTKPIPESVPAGKLQPKAPPQPGPGAAPGKADTRDLCSKLAFVTSSPLPSTGLRWDYKCQLQASGGYPPVRFSAYFKDDATHMESLGPYTSVRGLAITPSGLIQGQPEEAGYHTIHVVVQDSCPSGVQRIEKKFALEVKGPKMSTWHLGKPGEMGSGQDLCPCNIVRKALWAIAS